MFSSGDNNCLVVKNLRILKCIVELRVEKFVNKLRINELFAVDEFIFKSLHHIKNDSAECIKD